MTSLSLETFELQMVQHLLSQNSPSPTLDPTMLGLVGSLNNEYLNLGIRESQETSLFRFISLWSLVEMVVPVMHAGSFSVKKRGVAK